MPVVPPSLFIHVPYIQYPDANPRNRESRNSGRRKKEGKKERKKKERRSLNHTGSHPTLQSPKAGRKKVNPNRKKPVYHKRRYPIDRESLVFITKYPYGKMMSLRVLVSEAIRSEELCWGAGNYSLVWYKFDLCRAATGDSKS